MIIQCCACLRVRDNGNWERLEKPRVLEENTSHGYCPSCAQAAFAEIKAQQRSQKMSTARQTVTI